MRGRRDLTEGTLFTARSVSDAGPSYDLTVWKVINETLSGRDRLERLGCEVTIPGTAYSLALTSLTSNISVLPGLEDQRAGEGTVLDVALAVAGIALVLLSVVTLMERSSSAQQSRMTFTIK